MAQTVREGAGSRNRGARLGALCDRAHHLGSDDNTVCNLAEDLHAELTPKPMQMGKGVRAQMRSTMRRTFSGSGFISPVVPDAETQ